MKKTMLLSMVLTALFTTASAAVSASANVHDLVARLKTGLIETLYYGDKDIAPQVQEIIDSPGNEDLLVSAYRTADKDQITLKHTILIVMIKKQQASKYNADNFEAAKNVLVDALGDDHYWIRTEAVWGLRYFGDVGLMRKIVPLVEDKSDFVRKEAQSTLLELYELYQDMTDNKF